MVRGMSRKTDTPLRRGWTTGACATAATRAALIALWRGAHPDSVRITLPRGERPDFVVAHRAEGPGWAEALAPVADRVAATGVRIVTLPLTNLFLQGRQTTPSPRALAPVNVLREAGATVAAGDPVYWDPSDGRYTNTATHVRIPDAVFETGGADGGIVEVSLNLR